MSSYPVSATFGFHRCDNCDRVWHFSQLAEMEDLMSRIDPGGIVPSGDCPDCGAFCYPVKCAIEDWSEDRNVNWNNNLLQFSRLIAEMEAAGFFLHDSTDSDTRMADLCEFMDLTVNEVLELVGRAQDIWDNVKDFQKVWNDSAHLRKEQSDGR